VTIVDSNGNPVASASVQGQYTLNGLNLGSLKTGTTGLDGSVKPEVRPKVTASGSVFQLCVTNVTSTSYIFDMGASSLRRGDEAVAPREPG